MEQEKQTNRVSRIEEFLLDPEKTIFELLEEFGNSVEEIRNALSQVDVANLETLKGEDGKTPERGVDYFTDEDLDNIEAFILDRIPVVGEDVPSPKQVNEYIDKQVAKIPRVKGDKGNPGTPGKPGKNGSPDSALDIIKKLRSLDKNQGLQLNDIRGLSKKIALLNEVSDEFTKLKEDLSNIKILTSGASSDGTGAVASVNGKVGVVVLTQDDIGNGATYVRTENNFTDALLSKLTGLQTSYSFLNLTDTPSAYTGQAGKFVKVNATNDGLEFASIPGGGDMLASVYDPTNVSGDAFDMDNMAQGTTNKFLSGAELTVVQNTSGTNTGDQDATDFDIKDLTDSTNLRTTWNAKVDKSLFDANTILYATTDDTPVALTIPEQTIVGRKTGGNIEALAIDSDLSSVSANDDTVPSAKATKAYADSKVEDSIVDGHTTVAPSGNAVSDALALKLNTSSKATQAEVATGTDNDKYVTPLAVQPYSNNSLYRQAIINGNFDVWQRGTTATNPGQVTFIADRFMTNLCSADGGTFPSNIIHSRQLITPGDLYGSKYFYRLNVDGAGSSYGAIASYGIQQRIENGVQKMFGDGKTLTVSFYAKSDIANKKLGISLQASYGSGGSPSTGETINGTKWTLTSTWTKYTHTFTTNTLSGKTFGTDNNDYIRFNFLYMWGIDNAAQVGDTIAETFVGAGNIDIAQVQLNAGSVALPFQPKSFAEELRDCQRYYEKSYPYSVVPATSAASGYITMYALGTTLNGGRMGYIKYLVPKRVAPTVIIYPYTTPSNTFRVSDNSGSDLAANSGAVGENSEYGFNIQNGSGGSITTGNSIIFQYTASAEL